MSEQKPILRFYDLTSDLQPLQNWSANTMRARFILNYVKEDVPYETVWLTYPEIRGEVKRVFEQAGKQVDVFTVPFILDLRTTPPTPHIDSVEIIKFIFKEFPSSVERLKGIQDLDRHYQKFNSVQKVLRPLLFLDTFEILDKDSKIYFKKSKEENYGKKLQDFIPQAGGQDQIFEDIRRAWSYLPERMKDRPLDDQVNVLDFIDAVGLTWARSVSKEKFDKLLNLWGPDDDSVRKLYKLVEPYI